MAGSPLRLATRGAELYDPVTNDWRPTGSLARPRALHTATLLPDGRVLVAGNAGGWAANLALSAPDVAELFDPATGQWSPGGTLLDIRTRGSAALAAFSRNVRLGLFERAHETYLEVKK